MTQTMDDIIAGIYPCERCGARGPEEETVQCFECDRMVCIECWSEFWDCCRDCQSLEDAEYEPERTIGVAELTKWCLTYPEGREWLKAQVAKGNIKSSTGGG